MLFNSHIFLFLFLPLVAAVFFAIGRVSKTWAAAWLTAASLFFYAWWSPKYVLLLLASILFNFIAAGAISRSPVTLGWHRRRWLLTMAVAANLILLGYYKYANFFLDNFGQLTGLPYGFVEILLPLGISFFTFTQVAFLADAYQGKSSEPSFIHYCLFVTYFPHLIAGPVLHHKEMMPQFRYAKTYRPSARNLSVGITIFAIGLFKKVIIADSLAPYANAVFDAAASGHTQTLFEAWSGALAYTLQLYFDFSGYSDMAIGLSRMFNVVLPLNFHSPYKATNIIEFWRRWHMTLSRFLRDYLYIPLGGNRHGRMRRYLNLMITMLLGGLWHGAGWTFVLWGGLHGAYLIINNTWRALWAWLGHDNMQSTFLGRASGRTLTFAAVVAAWVVFRAENINIAISLLHGMAGLNGVGFADPKLFDSVRVLCWLLSLVVACWVLPNTQEILANFQPALDFHAETKSARIVWRPNLAWGIGVGALAAISVLFITGKSEFLYFQF